MSGSSNYEQNSGALLCLWSKEFFVLTFSIIGNGFIGLVGIWKNNNREIIIINVYSPCDMERKRILWQELFNHQRNSSCELWCLLGDFNSIRYARERIEGSKVDGGGGVEKLVNLINLYGIWKLKTSL